MGVKADARVWQEAALNELHPSWLPAFDPKLLRLGRESESGRRFIAMALQRKHAAILFGVRPSVPSDLHVPDRIQLGDLQLDLGAAALAPILRAEVSREAVALIESTLGEIRYRYVLRGDTPLKKSSEMTRSDIEFTASSILLSSDQLLSSVRLQGQIEILSASSAFDPAVQELLQLWMPRLDISMMSRSARLQTTWVAARLRRLMESPP